MSNSNKPNEIIMHHANLIKDVKSSFISLNETCLSFLELYDRYNQKHLYDSTLLKEKMKNIIIRTVSDDI